MGFTGFHRYGKAFDEGKVHYQYVTKIATPTPGTARFFVDMNQTAGQPKYNAFAGSQLAFNLLEGSGNAGVYVGNFVTGSSKHLLRWQVLNISTGAQNAPPDDVYLLDYLGFYPLIDCDDTDPQIMDNTIGLSRYASGEGNRIVFVVQAPMLATTACTVTYTNQAGVSGRQVTFNLCAGVNIGVAVTTSGATGTVQTVTPFLPLAGGDTGVRLIESVQMSVAGGGFVCAAIVKPIAFQTIYEAGVPAEKCFGFDVQNPPEILPGAYLNFLVRRNGTGAGSLRSELIFINS